MTTDMGKILLKESWISIVKSYVLITLGVSLYLVSAELIPT